MNRKQVSIVILIAFFIGALGSILLGHFVLPYLSNFRGLGWLSKITTNAPIVINHTEQVQLSDGVNLPDLIKQSSNFTVSIFDAKSNFLGNGLVVTSDGLIFTSTTVLDKQTQVFVVINNGEKYPATIRDKDTKAGLAILSIQASGLASGQFDKAADLVTGQRVIYLGRSNIRLERMAMPGFVIQALDNETGTKQVSSNATLTTDFFGGPIVNDSGHTVGLVLSNSQNIIAEDLQTALIKYLGK